MTYGNASPWTAEATAIFERGVHASKSFGEITEDLQRKGYNISRNAVIGKAHRLRISNGHKPGRNHGTLGQGRRKLHVQDIREKLKAAPMPKRKPPPELPPEEIAALDAARRSARTGHLIDLDHDQCRWIVTHHNVRPTLFCCDDKVPNSPYCAAHTIKGRATR